MSDVTVTLEPKDLKEYIRHVKKFTNAKGMSLDVIILSEDQEPLIHNSFFQGHLNDFVSFNTDRHGKLHMFLDHVKVRFTNKTDLFHPLFVLSNGPQKVPPTEVNPATGPGGSGPSGGTPIAAAIAA